MCIERGVLAPDLQLGLSCSMLAEFQTGSGDPRHLGSDGVGRPHHLGSDGVGRPCYLGSELFGEVAFEMGE